MHRVILIGAISTAISGATIGTVVYTKKINPQIEPNSVSINVDDVDNVIIEPADNENAAPKTKMKGTVEDFMTGKMGTDISCFFSHPVGEDSILEVVSYISGNKIRANYFLTADGLGWRNATSAISTLNIVYDGEYAFIWGKSFLGGMMDGMKYKLDYTNNEKIEKPDSEMTPEMLDFTLPVIDCRAWKVDNSIFKIPGELSFVEIDESNTEDLFEEVIEGGEIDVEELLEKDLDDPCAGCGFLPDSMKADCYAGCQ